jgi:ectoine hydroxylase-related dioxygenase (phytanoyl-CoA dioxygenase family)
MHYSPAVDEFERDGYAVIPNAVDQTTRSELRSTADRLLASTFTRGRDRGADGKDGFRGCLALAPSTFLPLIDNPIVLPLVVQLLSPNVHILSSHLIALPSVPPERTRSVRTPQRPGWHRDMYGVTADLGVGQTPRMAIKCAYYLTDITPQAGITMFLPGSHRLSTEPEIPVGQIDPPNAVTPSINACDAVLFENRTYHAGGLNTSGEPRISLMIQYGYRWVAPVDDPAPGLPDCADLTDIQRQLLGAPDRNRDGSFAKGKGAAPLYRKFGSRQPDNETNKPAITDDRWGNVPTR